MASVSPALPGDSTGNVFAHPVWVSFCSHGAKSFQGQLSGFLCLCLSVSLSFSPSPFKLESVTPASTQKLPVVKS